MKSHWDTLYACDFFSVGAMGITGTVQYMVFFLVEIKSRAVEIAGIAIDPGEAWMKQVARNLTDPIDGFLRGAKYWIHDRDPLFTDAFVAILKAGGVKIPAQSPNCNPHAERFVNTIKSYWLETSTVPGLHGNLLLTQPPEDYVPRPPWPSDQTVLRRALPRVPDIVARNIGRVHSCVTGTSGFSLARSVSPSSTA